MQSLLAVGILLLPVSLGVAEDKPKTTVDCLVRAVELNRGEEKTVALHDGSKAAVKLIDVEEIRDPVRHAMRGARVKVEVNGQKATIPCSMYDLPREVGGVQIDCPIVKGFVQPKHPGHQKNPWALEADARLRLWPKGSPWIRPGSFAYPVEQRWFVGRTQMANEIADNEEPYNKRFYYHYGLDFGGCDQVVPVHAVTDGLVVSVANKKLGKGPYPEIFKPRADVVYLRDDRGWIYRYSHFDSIDPGVKLGEHVKQGQKLGIIGKKGASGGWSHLHIDICKPQPSGRYGVENAYAYFWQVYQAAHKTPLVAVARPHQTAWVDQLATLDGSRSYGEKGPESLRYEWQFDDGTKAEGLTAQRRYSKPGTYSETLKVTDAAGRVDYDFASVYVQDPKNVKKRPPRIHATYWPSLDIHPGDEITFKVRSFFVSPKEGQETWDFGDGSPTVTTQSDGNKDYHAPHGYGVTTHRYAKPGVYVVRVTRDNKRGEPATAKLVVRVDADH
ncbi:MAG: peptidoglycan DD-metalloendopeptidase family protein [Pirellulales bacterium]|nr:peptidoglycan DD-metalloendopeptidase family protein [Pirellulales bacterium]